MRDEIWHLSHVEIWVSKEPLETLEYCQWLQVPFIHFFCLKSWRRKQLLFFCIFGIFLCIIKWIGATLKNNFYQIIQFKYCSRDQNTIKSQPPRKIDFLNMSNWHTSPFEWDPHLCFSFFHYYNKKAAPNRVIQYIYVDIYV